MSVIKICADKGSINSNNQQIVHQKVIEKAIKTSKKDGPIFAGPAGRFNWVFSFHDFFVDPEALDAFANEFWNHYKSRVPLQIGGLEISGIPLVVAIICKAKELGLDCTGFFIRKERKTRALVRTIDGKLNDNPIVIVDDVFKTGMSMERARVSLQKVGKKVDSVCTILDFNKDAGKQWSKNNDIPVCTFFSLGDFDLKHAPIDGDDPWDRRKYSNIKYESLWYFSAPNPLPTHIVPKSTPLLVNSVLFFGTDSGAFFALDAKNGTVLWKFNTKMHHEKGILSAPSYYNGKVYFGAYNGNVYCLDATTGKLFWKCSACDWIKSSPVIIPSQGKLVIGLEYAREKWKGGLAALDLETGEKIWEYQLASHPHGSPEYFKEQNIVVLTCRDDKVIALDSTSGVVLWEKEAGVSEQYSKANSGTHNIVATSSFDGWIRVNSLNDGKTLFEFETGDICYSKPLIHRGFLYCGSGDRRLYIIDIDKNELVKTIKTSGRIYGSAAVVDGNVIFGNTAGALEEINGATFETEQAILLPDAITNQIIISPDQKIIYVMTYLNEIYALRRKRIETE